MWPGPIEIRFPCAAIRPDVRRFFWLVFGRIDQGRVEDFTDFAAALFPTGPAMDERLAPDFVWRVVRGSGAIGLKRLFHGFRGRFDGQQDRGMAVLVVARGQKHLEPVEGGRRYRAVFLEHGAQGVARRY